jgi:hypothetical protein
MALTDNLQAFYKLSDLSDSSGNNRALTNNGNVTFASGKIGNAGVFDGNNYLSGTGNIVFGTSDFSVAGWVNATNLDGSQKMYYVGGSNGFTISLMDGILHTANANVADLYDFNSSDITNNSWFHLLVKRSGAIFTAYVNGQSIGTHDSGDTVEFTGDSQFIGAYIGGGYNVEGQIDAVGIWDRALSDAEVAELYNNGTGLELEVPNLNNGLQAFYKLSDLSDSSGNNRTLTPNGTVSFVSGKIGNCFQAAGGGGYLTSEFDGSSWTEFSLNFWAKVTGQIYPNIIYQMDIFGPNNMPLGYVEGLDYRPIGYSHGDSATIGEWVHFVIAAKNSNGTWGATIYKNGSVLPCPDLDANGFTPVINGIKIGTSGEMQSSNMQIDAFGIWNRELNISEVAALYNNGTGLELDPPNYRGEWDNFADYGQDDVVSVSGVYWKLTGLGGWTVGGAPGLGYGWTLLAPASVGGKVSLSGRISLSGRVKFAV